MPFRLINAPASFQAFINSVLCEYLDQFSIAYMDDILVYFSMAKEYTKQVYTVLKKLKENNLLTCSDKCAFH